MNKEKLLFTIGRPFGGLYGLVMQLRQWFYSRGIIRQYRLPVAVVSVGNLTWGGTGKTPMVIYLCRLCKERGYSPLIISRGYHGRAIGQVNVVSDGQSVLMDAGEAGDEPHMMAVQLPGVPVITCKERAKAGRYAVRHFSPDVLFMDDGFQHLALHRDMNIVLFRAHAPLGNGRIFPAGPLRESTVALKRADCFVVTGEGEEEDLQQVFLNNAPAAPFFKAKYHPARVIGDSREYSWAEMRNKPVVAFCGIGNPASFRSMLLTIGVDCRDFIIFPDHHDYSEKDVKNLEKIAYEKKAELLLTTEKDQVKMNGKSCVPLAGVTVNLVPEAGFSDYITQRLHNIIKSKG